MGIWCKANSGYNTIKKKLTILGITSALLVKVASIIPIIPVITVVNNTHEPLYIYAGESIYNVEPDDEEIVRMVKSKPKTVAPGEELKLTASFMSLIRKDAAIDIGWEIGGRDGYKLTGVGGQNFRLVSDGGYCTVLIEVEPGYDNSTLKGNKEGLCLKNIDPFHYQYSLSLF